MDSSVTNGQFDNNFECPACQKLLRPQDDEDGARECLECEVGICKKCVTALGKEACPNCGKKEGFNKKLTKLRVKELESLLFVCPNIDSCSAEPMTFIEAEWHYQTCDEKKCNDCSHKDAFIN